MKDYTPKFSPSGVEVNIMPVIDTKSAMQFDAKDLPDVLPILTLRNAVIFPGTVYPVTVGRERSIKLVQEVEASDGLIGAVPQTDITVEDPKIGDLSRYGTVAKLVKTIEMPDGTLTAIIQGLKRLELVDVVGYEPYMVARVHYVDDFTPPIGPEEMKILMDSLKEKAGSIVKSSSYAPKEAVAALRSVDNYEFLVNFIATTIEVENFNEKVDLLQWGDMQVRGMKLLSLLETQVQLQRIKQEINQKVRSDIDQQQREYFLNNQLRTIQEELGMDDAEDFQKFRDAAAKKKWSDQVKAIFEKEMARLEKYNPNTPDYSIQYNFIQFMLDLPWGEMSKDNLDLKNAQQVLDEDHFGLETVKDRIIEYLAVLKLKGNMKSPILCLYGPPGVGKTSLGKSIARALGRKYVRISLGGMHDEA